MKDTEYAYAVAYMKTLENKMLTKNDYEALITAQNFSQALKLITDKGYGKNVSTELTIENILESELQKIWQEAEACLPEEAPLDILKYKNNSAKYITEKYNWDDVVNRTLKLYGVEILPQKEKVSARG